MLAANDASNAGVEPAVRAAPCLSALLARRPGVLFSSLRHYFRTPHSSSNARLRCASASAGSIGVAPEISMPASPS